MYGTGHGRRETSALLKLFTAEAFRCNVGANITIHLIFREKLTKNQNNMSFSLQENLQQTVAKVCTLKVSPALRGTVIIQMK